jgi:WD40 repeat protein
MGKKRVFRKLQPAAILLLALAGSGTGLGGAMPPLPRADRGGHAQPPAAAEARGPGKNPAGKPGTGLTQLIHSLSGHKDRVKSVAYSPNGRWIATASWDGTARLWDARTGKEVRRLDVPPTRDHDPAYLSQVLFSPDSELVVTAQQSAPNEPGVIVWKRGTGERVRDFPGLCAALAAGGKQIACGGWGMPDPNQGDIRICDLASGKLIREIHTPYSRVDGLIFSHDGQTLFSQVGIPRPPLGNGLTRLGHDGSQVRAWNVATGKERPSGLEGAWNQFQAALSPDGRSLALASGISLRETATGKERIRLIGHTQEVCAVAFSPDGRTLASGSMDGTVRLWDLPSGKEVGRLGMPVAPFAGHGWVLAVAFSPDGRTLVSGGLDPIADHWDVSRVTGRPRQSAEQSAAGLKADWKDLAVDAARGYAALGRLIASPKGAVPFLGQHLAVARVAAADTERLERLIADLDDGAFQVRQRATKELMALGDRAAPALRKALAGQPSLEVRRRLEALLDRVEVAGPSVETVREIRAVETLEAIGNAEAQALLHQLAKGPAEMRLTQEAKAATARRAKGLAASP